MTWVRVPAPPSRHGRPHGRCLGCARCRGCPSRPRGLEDTGGVKERQAQRRPRGCGVRVTATQLGGDGVRPCGWRASEVLGRAPWPGCLLGLQPWDVNDGTRCGCGMTVPVGQCRCPIIHCEEQEDTGDAAELYLLPGYWTQVSQREFYNKVEWQGDESKGHSGAPEPGGGEADAITTPLSQGCSVEGLQEHPRASTPEQVPRHTSCHRQGRRRAQEACVSHEPEPWEVSGHDCGVLGKSKGTRVLPAPEGPGRGRCGVLQSQSRAPGRGR